MNHAHSESSFKKANQYIPGGVNSPVRAFRSVGGKPIFIHKGQASRLYDVDGNEYIDFVCSWGASILGHAHPAVVAAVSKAAADGLSFGAPTEAESQLAEIICGALPSIEKIRLVSSGTEACMSAIRLARAFTGKNKIIKFSGSYHGHADMLLTQAGSGVATFGLPDSAGVPKETTMHTMTSPYNDMDALETLCSSSKEGIAAIIVEPVAGNMGFVMPSEGFLSGLRKLCDRLGALLIFDEVMTGFRVAWGGYQNLSSIRPDLTTLGKVIGGGMPLAAYGGKQEIMDLVAPSGPMYQAGTLSGNPVAVAAGIATLDIMKEKSSYDLLNHITYKLVHGLKKAANNAGIPLQGGFCGGMFGLFFHSEEVKSYEDAKKSNTLLFKNYFNSMLEKGIYFAPSAFEAGFVSIAHTDQDIEQVLDTAKRVFENLSHIKEATC